MATATFRETLFRYYRFFYRYARARMWWLIVMMFVMSYAEALGIALFYPVLSGGLTTNDSLGSAIGKLLSLFHIAPTLTGSLVALVVVFALKGLFQFFGGAYQYRLSSTISREVREDLVGALARADYQYVSRLSTGTIANLVTVEVGRTSTAFVYFSRLFPHVLSILIFFAIVVLYSPSFASIAAGVGLVGLVLLRAPSRLSARYSQRTTVDNGILASLLVQTIHAFKYLRSTDSFGRLTAYLTGTTRRIADYEYKVGALYSLSSAAAQPFIVLFLAAVLYERAVVHSASMAPIFIMAIYLYRVMTEVFGLQAEWQNFTAYVGGLDAVSTTMTALQSNAEPQLAAGVDASRTVRAIALEGVSFRYGDRPALEDVSLQIDGNSTVAFVGESGAGKSTLADLLCATLRPTSGRITVGGQPLGDLDVASYRRLIGYVPQDGALFDDTVANNISLFGCDVNDSACRARVEEAARRAHCHEFVVQIPRGYDAVIGDRGVALSGGQRQRLAIARELFKQPSLLILDEATSALDSDSEAAIRRSIDDLKGKMTIVIIAHRLSTIRGADAIYVLDKGRIVERGTFAELYAVADSRFRKMCDMQNLT